MTMFTRRALGALAAAALVLGGGAITAAAAPATAAPPATPVLTGIRTGAHPGFDRIVLDWSGPAPTVRARAVSDLVSDGSGQTYWLTGEHFVSVAHTPAVAHRSNGSRSFTGPDRFRTKHLRNVMAVGVVGDFEGYVTIGLGTRYRSAVTVFTLSSPTRTVIDVKL